MLKYDSSFKQLMGSHGQLGGGHRVLKFFAMSFIEEK